MIIEMFYHSFGCKCMNFMLSVKRLFFIEKDACESFDRAVRSAVLSNFSDLCHQFWCMNVREIFFRQLAQTSPAPLALEIERAEGVFLYDTAGKRYFDLISGISVSNTGHRHPRVLDAIRAQLEKYLHLMVYGEYIQQPQVMLAEKICSLLPPSLNSVYFVNSGSEAVEGAMKLAKRYTGRSGFIGFYNAYHGSSQGALSLMGCEEMKQAFRPLLPGMRFLHFNNIEDLEKIDESIAAVVIEPVQGEAGVRLPDTGYMQQLAFRCREKGVLLIADEIQTGMGRTGKMFGFEHYGIVPDIVLLAKALGGGLPLGAFVAGNEMMRTLSFSPVLGHITTFGGHPLSCVAALASLDVIIDERLTEQVFEKAEHFRQKLAGHSAVAEWRNAGLLMAFELKEPEAIQGFISSCLERGVIVDWFLFAPTAVRLAPPLSITFDEIDESCECILHCLNEL